MKKIIAILLLAVSSLAFAEASFDEIQGLINSKQYAAAEAGLEVIIKNHPNSAKAFYAMAEAQAGLGNLDKAQKALNLAKGIDPTLKFVSEGSVRSLEQAITPQTQKITYEEPSHFWRNLFLLIFVGAMAWVIYYFFVYKNKKADDDYKTGTSGSGPKDPTPDSPIKPSTRSYASSYVPPARPAYRGHQASVTPAPSTPAPAPAPTTTVVNNSSNDGLLTGMIIGNMMSNHHETTRVVEREVIRETPSRNSSWDDTPSRSSSSSRDSSWDDSSSSSRSSSWDDDSSSKRSSSWDDSSSSSSSSSWDSGSSSSDSSSSSSWD